MKESFILFNAYKKHLDKLTQSQKGCLLDAIFQYSEDNTTIELEPVVDMAFSFIREDMDRNEAKWNERAERARENGKLGGRPRLTNMDNQKTQKTQSVISKPRKPVNVNVNVNDNVNDNNNNNVSKDTQETPVVSYGNKDVTRLIDGLYKNLDIKLPIDRSSRNYANNMLKLLTRNDKENRQWLKEDKWENAKWFAKDYDAWKVQEGYQAQSWKKLYEHFKVWFENKGDISKLMKK